MNNDIKESEDETSIQSSEQIKERCYSKYKESSDLAFDPMKELNLPSSYDEVLARFKTLQVDRAMEALN